MSHAMPQHADGDYAEKIRHNAATFHKNFSAGDFDRNGPLVHEKIYVHSNGVIVNGRHEFVQRIKRYETPFPGLQLVDRIILVDDNVVGLLYVLQGTHLGPFGNMAATGRKVNAYAVEFFTMDEHGLMKKLLTITQLHRLARQIKGEEAVPSHKAVELAPLGTGDLERKKRLKSRIESLGQDFNTRDWDSLTALLADDVQVDWNGAVGHGRQAVLDGLDKHRGALPDLSLHLEHNVVEGDRGAFAWTMNGTLGAVAAGPASRPARVSSKVGVHVRFDSADKIREMTVVSNMDELDEQLKGA